MTVTRCDQCLKDDHRHGVTFHSHNRAVRWIQGDHIEEYHLCNDCAQKGYFLNTESPIPTIDFSENEQPKN